CCVVEIRFIPLILSKWLWLFSVFVFPLCLCVSSAAGGSKIQAQKAPKPKEKLPPAERITDTLYRVGKAMVDTAERTVTCRGEINMDNGPIEYLGSRHTARRTRAYWRWRFARCIYRWRCCC